jgi:hypothetical protein
MMRNSVAPVRRNALETRWHRRQSGGQGASGESTGLAGIESYEAHLEGWRMGGEAKIMVDRIEKLGIGDDGMFGRGR